MKDILVKARKEGYGVIATSIFNAELIKSAITAAENRRSPLILNINLTNRFVLDDQDLEFIAYVARQRAMRASVPVAFNLDHGKDIETVARAIRNGFTSVMIDASSKPYEENVRITSEVVKLAHLNGIPVEAELGCVGVGDPNCLIEGKTLESTMTDPLMVKDFVEKTDCDFLAVSIGNAHGPYAKNIIPHIDFDRLQKIAEITPIPLVLHGGSGTGDENLSKACRMGISKINVATDLLKAGVSNTLEEYEKDNNLGRLRWFDNYSAAYEKMAEYYIDVFGSAGKAN